MIDFRSKKSRELMNSITAPDEASEESNFFQLSALEDFVHETLQE